MSALVVIGAGIMSYYALDNYLKNKNDQKLYSMAHKMDQAKVRRSDIFPSYVHARNHRSLLSFKPGHIPRPSVKHLNPVAEYTTPATPQWAQAMKRAHQITRAQSLPPLLDATRGYKVIRKGLLSFFLDRDNSTFYGGFDPRINNPRYEN